MRSINRYPLAGLIAILVAGCSDSTGLDINPILARDTVTIAAPLPGNQGKPSALDVTGAGGFGIIGPRFPEQISDALAWDVTLRLRNGQLVLLPPGGIGIPGVRAAITPAIAGQTFEGLREIPGQSTFRTDTAIVMQLGQVYAIRSREVGFGCTQFAKIQPLNLDLVEGTAQFDIITNERCGDPRLVAVD